MSAFTMAKEKFTPPKVIAVDVDGTLARGGKVIDWCRRKKAEGFSLILWSSRGEEHAREVAERFGVTDIFDHILSKPGYILDDKGWSWTKYTRIIRRLDAAATEEKPQLVAVRCHIYPDDDIDPNP